MGSLLFSLLFLGFSVFASSASISDNVFKFQDLVGSRNLLQAKTPCPVNFEFQNYTIITSQCKGPGYPPSICCPAFLQFACPFSDQLNDLSNDCSDTMFSYINLYGKYPPGLFSSECRGDKKGLICPALPPSEKVSNSSSSLITCNPSVLLMLSAGFLILLVRGF